MKRLLQARCEWPVLRWIMEAEESSRPRLMAHTAPTQLAPLAFDRPVFRADATDGWLALIRDGKPVGIAKARPFMRQRYGAYWKPIDAATAALYRCTLEEIDA